MFNTLRRSFLTEALKFGPSGGGNLAFLLTTLPTTTSQPATTLSMEILRTKYYVSETDLLLSIWFALDSEVPFERTIIAGNDFTALKNFIYVLKKYFPMSTEIRDTLTMLNLVAPQNNFTRSTHARKLFADMYENLNSRNEISVTDWRTLLKDLEVKNLTCYITIQASSFIHFRCETKHNQPFPSNSDWQHCKGSEPKYRGYTCGLWSNFHTLTVNSFLEDSFKPNFDPFLVLQAIKGYVAHFFGCTECASHFNDMVTRELPMEDWVHYASDTVMYLWRAHNHVNKRLSGDITEDPVMMKRQFPATFLCENCQDSNGAWDSRVALRFLLTYYTNIRPHVENINIVNGDNKKVNATFNNNVIRNR